MSQEDEILKYLKTGKSLTPIEALEKFGTLRLSARIERLRKCGYPINTHSETSNGKTYARYRMAV